MKGIYSNCENYFKHSNEEGYENGMRDLNMQEEINTNHHITGYKLSLSLKTYTLKSIMLPIKVRE